MYELEKVEYAEAKKHYSSCIDLIGEYTDYLLLSERPVKYCVKTFEALKKVCFTRIREIKKLPPVDNYEKIEGCSGVILSTLIARAGIIQDLTEGSIF